MNAQKPAEGIMKLSDHGDLIFFKVACDCMDNDHNATITLEMDSDYHDVTMQIYTEVKTAWWRNNFEFNYDDWYHGIAYFANDWINRFRLVWQALTKGYIVMESHTLMRRQALLNFAQAMQDGVKQIDEFTAAKQLKKEQDNKV